MINSESIQKELFAYAKDNTFKDTSKLTSETMLFVEGIFDSMGFALLLDFLEEKFSVVANDSDLIEENFESIHAITDFVLRKKEIVAQ